MKLSIIYYFTNYSDNKLNALKSLEKIDNENVEVLVFNSCVDGKVFEFLNKLKFNKSKLKIINTYDSVGHSFAYNIGTRISNSDYIYYSNSRTLFDKELLKSILNELKKNPDIISINSNIKENKINGFNDFIEIGLSLKNFIFKKSFVINNHLSFTNYNYFHNVFVYEAILKTKNIFNISYNIEQRECSNCKYSYNLYDILKSAEIIFNKTILNDELKDNEKESINAILTVSILYEFIDKTIKSNLSDSSINIALNNANSVINKIYPKYKKNSFFIKNKNPIYKYILNFNPSLKYVKKEFTNIKK